MTEVNMTTMNGSASNRPEVNNAPCNLDTSLSDEDLRFLFVGGKGGVGKTTTSSSLAVHFASRRRVLLISTDPAHSLGDAFNEPFEKGVHSSVIESGDGLLDVLEIDPREALEEEMKTWGELAELSGMIDTKDSMNDLQNWLCQVPGIDEAMAIASVVQRMESNEYDLVIFDTAPTGHTLKLLQMPELLAQLLSQLRSWQSNIWSYFATMSQFTGGNVGETAISARQKIEQKLDDYRISIEQVGTMIQNRKQTAFIVVCIAEHLSVQETKRLTDELKQKQIRVAGLVVNMLFPILEDQIPRREKSELKLHNLMKSRRLIQEKYLHVLHALDVPVVEVPLQENEVTGVSALRDFSTFITQATVGPAHDYNGTHNRPRIESLTEHATVEIHGLSKEEYNGLLGVIKSYDPATERYATRLMDGSGKSKVLALRVGNLFLRQDLIDDIDIQSFLDNPRLFEAYQAVLKQPSAINDILKDPELGDMLRRTTEKMKPIL
eukprot:GEMP01030800.1.p1 GENE.GEMP01030800.1~~GEMP01030800.1.p1  ORF type:complete len:493 (+),score=62.12 GEMP01030800.1:74-1552(+)